MSRLLFGLLAAFVLSGCDRSAPAPEAAAPAGADLISLSPAITETVALLGATDRLAGRSDWCNEPASVRSLPAFGTSLTPALERIATVHPARILIDASASNQREQLAAVAPVETLPWLTVAEVIDSTRRLGLLVGHANEAKALAARFEPWLRPLPAGARSVLLLIGDDGAETGTFWFVKDDSLHGAMLRATGWKNAITGSVTTPSLSAEGLLRLNPEAIVMLVPKPLTKAEQQQRISDFARFEGLRAVVRKRLAVVADANILSTGPSLLTSADRLAEVLRPWGAE